MLGAVSIGMSPSGKAPDFDSGIRRFKSCHPSQYDPLAQLAEQLPFKQWVRGSNPRRVTTAILNKVPKKSSFLGLWLFQVLTLTTESLFLKAILLLCGIAFFYYLRDFCFKRFPSSSSKGIGTNLLLCKTQYSLQPCSNLSLGHLLFIQAVKLFSTFFVNRHSYSGFLIS